jgi:hypothetical protein
MTNLTQNSFSRTFISILYMFRATMCPSSGELIVSIRHLVYVTLCIDNRLVRTPNGHLYRVTYTRYRIDTINSPDDGHMAARNMYRIGINIHENEFCVKLVIYKDYTEMHGQQNTKRSISMYISISSQMIVLFEQNTYLVVNSILLHSRYSYFWRYIIK